LVYIIAEAGLAHLGSVRRAKELIEKAYICGADAVKFQYYDPYRIFPKKEAKKREKMMLSMKQYNNLYEWKIKKGYKIDFGLSIFDFDLIPQFDFLKIGSRAIYITEAILMFVDKKIPIFISTGYAFPKKMSYLLKQKNVTFLACDAEYPSFYMVANEILKLKKKYGKAGYSSHLIGYDDCLVAVKMGACVIEKHFCLKRKNLVFDKEHSLEPNEFAQMVKKIRVEEQILKRIKRSVYSNK